MSEDKKYKDADIVWVKLGNNWWPGEVTDVHRQPEGLLTHFKKKPYCVVKFFEEESYEYVRNSKQIFPFKCQKKEEFIKKGLALFNAKNKFMEKFPSDVETAENLSSPKKGTITTTVNDSDSMVEAMLSQTRVHECTNDKNDHSKSIQYLNIVPNQRLTKLTTSQTISQTTSNNISSISAGSKFNSNIYKCNQCNFTSLRQNVMIFHRRTHSSSSSSSSAPKQLTNIENDVLPVNNEDLKDNANNEKNKPVIIEKPQKIDDHRKSSEDFALNTDNLVTTTSEVEPIEKNTENNSEVKGKAPRLSRKRGLKQSSSTTTTIETKIESDEDEDESRTKTENIDNCNSSVHQSAKSSPNENSEDLRQRLLADWSDEDNVILEEMKSENKLILKEPIKKEDDGSIKDDNNHPKLPELQEQLNTEIKSLKRIRNIPKKDRRELILKEFNSESILKSNDTHGEMPSNPVEEKIKTNVSSSKESKKIISCFDFHDEEDDDESAGVEQNTLKSISIFKKKLLESTNDSLVNSKVQEETSQKFNELSEEIQNLLEQTSATISDVYALQKINSNKKEDLNVAASVKGLPIKERGKRIFKSRNRTQSNEENNEKTLNESSIKLQKKEETSKEEKLQILRIVDKPADLSSEILIDEKISPIINNEEEIVAEDGSSSISEADAEFGSSTSMMDDDRFSVLEKKNLIEQDEEEEVEEEITEKTKLLFDDEEEIESPPHEELSGNELEEEIKRIRYKSKPSPRNLAVTNTSPKKQLIENQKQNQDTQETTHMKSSVDNISILSSKRKRIKLMTGREKNKIMATSKENTTNELLNVKDCETLIEGTKIITNTNESRSSEEKEVDIMLESSVSDSREKKHLSNTKLITTNKNLDEEIDKTLTINELNKQTFKNSSTLPSTNKDNVPLLQVKRQKEINDEELEDVSSGTEGIVKEQIVISKLQNRNLDEKLKNKRKYFETKTNNESKVSRKSCHGNNGISKISIEKDTKILDSKIRKQSEERSVLHATKIINPEESTVIAEIKNKKTEVKEFTEKISDTEYNEQISKISKKNQQPQSLTKLNVDNGQILETQNDEQDENPKFLAVPTHPIPGYNETFLLCTIENNQYKPIDGVPLYLDQDLNQLQPVPLEALEGQSILIVNQSPVDVHIPHTLKTSSTLPVAAVAEEETQMLCLPTQVSDVMAEAAAATVSTIMTPALVKGNESNLQINAPPPINTSINKESINEPVFLMADVESAVATDACDLLADNAIIVSVNGQQIILEGQILAQLLANPEGSTQLVTDDGTEFVMTRELLAALEAQQQQEIQLPLLERTSMSSPSPQDILAVALAGSELYGSEILELENSQTMQLVCNDSFQPPGVHLSSPITAQTSETNALLNQTPIMSTLEVPTSTISLSEVGEGVTDKLMNSHKELAKHNLEDSLAVIGVTPQSSAIPTSLELPITVTNPAIAPRVSLSNVLPVSEALLQFGVQRSVSIIGDVTNFCNDA